MNFDFSDDQKLLREQAREIPDRAIPAGGGAAHPRRPRAVRQGRSGDEMAEMGWLGAAIPEEYGGAGLRRIWSSACWPRRSAAPSRRSRSPRPSISPPKRCCSPAATRRRRSGCRSSPPARPIGSLRDGGGPPVADPRSACARRLPTARLTGTKDAGAGRRLRRFRGCASARYDGAASASCSSISNGAGVTRDAVKTLDPTRGHAELKFDDAPAEPLGAAGEGWELLAQAARSRRGADRLRAGRRRAGGLEMARDYAHEPLRLRPADRLVPGDQAQARRHVRRRSSWRAPTPITAPGRCRPTPPSCRSPRRRARIAPATPSSSPPRRTSRRTAAWASPGSSTATSTTAAPSCSALSLGSARGVEGPPGQRARDAERAAA